LLKDNSNVLYSTIFRRGASRIVAVSKLTNESILNNNTNNNNPNKQLIFSLNNPQLMHEINTYLQSCPISAGDNELLQAKIQKTPSSLNGKFKFRTSVFILLFQIGFIVHYYDRVIYFLNHRILNLKYQINDFFLLNILFNYYQLIKLQHEIIYFISLKVILIDKISFQKKISLR